MYSIPREINSEIKITKLFYLSDFIFMASVLTISLAFESYVHSNFQTLYFIFCLLLGIFFSLPVPNSAGKRRWESYMFWLFSDRNWYCAMTLDREVKSHEKEENKTRE